MKKLKKRWLFLAAALLLAVLLGAELYRSAYTLTVTHYEIAADKVTAPLRILQLTDLHNSEFGKNNRRLLALVEEQAPDLILFTGDLVTGTVEGTETAASLLESLVEIAPVYVSIGNHEQLHERNFGSDLTALYTAAGATVLEHSWQDIQVNGQSLRIGGASGYCVPERYLRPVDADECAFLKEYQQTDSLRVLMAHMPACWIRNDGISEWDCDLVYSGHVHGGQIILPGLGGVYGPDMGWFAGRLEGLFPSGDGEKTMILSRGLGSSTWIPRFNNVPEIVVTDIVPSD